MLRPIKLRLALSVSEAQRHCPSPFLRTQPLIRAQHPPSLPTHCVLTAKRARAQPHCLRATSNVVHTGAGTAQGQRDTTEESQEPGKCDRGVTRT